MRWEGRMKTMLRSYHEQRGGRFIEVNGVAVVDHYGDPATEEAVLREGVGLMDLSYRSRLCVLGKDRVGFLHGQVTNDVRGLSVGQGCHAVLVNARGRILADLHIFMLADEILLDFDPGYADAVIQRLQAYIIAEDVEVVDVGSLYGCLSIQGPRAGEVMTAAAPGMTLPEASHDIAPLRKESAGEIYVARRARLGVDGFDVFAPVEGLPALADELEGAGPGLTRWCGWQALEMRRIACGRPRYGADMDESNLAPETGLEAGAISTSKGCYIGQEVIARIRTYGQVAKALRRLELPADLDPLPSRGEKLWKDGKEVGRITSAVRLPGGGVCPALGYVRKECNAIGTTLRLVRGENQVPAQIVGSPS